MGDDVHFLSRQEMNQRSRHRGGVNIALPRAKSTLPYVPHPGRTWYLRSTLTTEDRFLLLALLLAGCVTTPALRLNIEDESFYREKELLRYGNWSSFHFFEDGWAGIGTFPPFVLISFAFLC